MARRSKAKTLTVRTVRSKEDRKRPSVFFRLKVDEYFRAVALFEPDPELKDNPGYFEYYDHWDNQGNQYVPCAGDQCPFCAANDNPYTRALTVWYFPDEDAKNSIKVFTMNYGTLNDISDEAEEEDGILGKKIRVKRMSDKGDYKVKVLGDKPLAKAEMKKVMALLEEKFPEGLEALVNRQLKAQMERLKAMDALEDGDDDDDDEEPTKARRGRSVKDDDDDEDEDEDGDESETPEAIEDETFEILKVSKKNNTITVEYDDEEIELGGEDFDASEHKKGDTVVVSAEWDDDDEAWLVTEIEEADAEAEGDDDDEDESESGDDEGDEEEPEEISGVEYEVVKVQERDEIFDLKNDDGKVKMWLGEGVDVDYDEVKKGVKVKIDAETDDEGDWIITALEAVPEKKPRGRPKGSGTKRGGKSKAKK